MLHEPTGICDAIAGQRRFPVHANGACDSLRCHSHKDRFLNQPS
jgi:hypothetical protein